MADVEKNGYMDFLRYRRLYRVLRDDENRLDGIQAKDPWSLYSVEEHVGNGHLWTMFISTSASRCNAERFAKSDKTYQAGKKKIAVIDVARLTDNVKYVDLTDKVTREAFIPNDKHVQMWAKIHKEVLLVGYIPRHCILETYSV